MWQRVLLCALLCAGAARANVKTSGRQTALTPAPAPAPRDSGRECSCSGVFSRSLDCSNRGRSAFRRNELCRGRTTRIDLSRNSFTTFPAEFGSYITEVNVSRNQLTSLPRAPPLNANTGVLDVSYNRIAQSSNELQTLSSLKILSVDSNLLQSLAFLPQSCDLRHLSARHNLLRNFDGPLQSCVKLETLDLSYNRFSLLPRGVLAGLKKLEVLRVSNCELNTLSPGSLENLKKLEYLDLSQNQLTALPSAIFASLKDLEKLHLENNSISNLPIDSFVGLKDLELLVLTKNRLVSLPQGIFTGLANVKTVMLNENEIRSLPSGLCEGMQKLKTIDLSKNKLEGLPSTIFLGIRELKTVNLQHNYLRTLPGSLFSGITSMETINFGNNQLTALPPGLFQEMNSVVILNLSHNQLTYFNGRDLAGLKSLEQLDITFNRLTTLPAYDATWPVVTKASFGFNSIVDVSEHVLRSWLGSGDKKRTVSLEGRPPLSSPASLRWVLGDRQVTTSVSADCQCGGLKRDKAQVQFCVAVSCPRVSGSWVEAVRASAPAPVSVKG